jgi:hypothetical protein
MENSSAGTGLPSSVKLLGGRVLVGGAGLFWGWLWRGLVSRWQSGPSDAEEGKEQVEFSWKQRVRKGLGRLALSKN